MKAGNYIKQVPSKVSFVSTNSICQGEQVPTLWPLIYNLGLEISFAHTSFKWANLASHNAGVTVAIVGVGPKNNKLKSVYSLDESGELLKNTGQNINAYLAFGPNIIVAKKSHAPEDRAKMVWEISQLMMGIFSYLRAGKRVKI